MVVSRIRKVLFIGAHPDDIELGCGATIAKHIASWQVRCVILSANQENPENVRLVTELSKSLRELGVDEENIAIGDFRTRYFDQSRQAIRDFLLREKGEFNPDAVFTHALSDIHQDHIVTCQEVQRIFRDKNLFGFEIQRSTPHFYPTLHIALSLEDVEAKIRALSRYETYRNKPYLSPEVIKSLLITRGLFVEEQFAEAFEVYSLIIR